ncbi:MAG: serine/threonine protein kinase, partial [Deltaproteobacteria bacterium]|nr:serine/threonine protein kinase [Deltaproteobacteria bacterium]
PLTRLALSADGRRAAVAGRDRTIRVYALPDGKPLATLAWHQANVTALAWGAGPTLLSGDGDGKLAVWEIIAAP